MNNKRFLCRNFEFSIERWDVAKELIELDQEFDRFGFANDDIPAIRNVAADIIIVHAYNALQQIKPQLLDQVTPKR